MNLDFQEPHSNDIEAALLATILRGDSWQTVSGRVEAEEFFAPEHQAIFAAIADLAGEGKKIGPISVNARLDPELHEYTRTLNGQALTTLKSDAAYWADTVRDLACRRRILREAWEIADAAVNGEAPALDVAAAAVSKLSTVSDASRDFEDGFDVAGRVVDGLSEQQVAYPTGLRALDEAICGGLMPGRLYGVGGRQKQGKSLLLGSISFNMALAGTPHLYLALEMSAEELMHRQLAREMGINAMSFVDPQTRRDPDLAYNAAQAMERFRSSGLYFLKRPRMSLDDLKATISRAALSGKVTGVIVDYLQLVSGQGRDTLTAHYENVAQALAECAKLHRIWILVAFQVNQEGGVRYGEGLLNACDLALFLGRKEAEYRHLNDLAWLEMRVSRFTPLQDIGNENVPAFVIDRKVGPHFRDIQEQPAFISDFGDASRARAEA